MVTGDHGEGGNQQNVRLIVALVVHQGLEAERGREQGNAVERYSLIAQVSGNARSARCSVTFAEEEQRRAPAFVTRQIQPDEFAEGFDIALHAQEFFGQLGVGSAAEAG